MAEQGGVDEGVIGEQLAAVRLMIVTPRRRAAEYDILLATVFNRLHEGPKTTDELLGALHATWPQAPTNRRELDTALSAAEKAGQLSRVIALDGAQSWTLRDAGVLEFETSREWAEHSLERSVRALREEARIGYREVRPSEARQWLAIIMDALARGIRPAYEVYRSGTAVTSGGTLIPHALDHNAMFRYLDSQVHREDVRTFLAAMLTAAIDPSDPFGNEIVHYVTVGYLLQSFISRNDLRRIGNTTGTLRGERVVLDTPVVLSLLGPRHTREALREMISIAVDERGMAVIVTEHTLEELRRLIERLGAEVVPDIERYLRDRPPDVLQQIVDDQVIQLWLSGMTDGTYKSWREFVAAAEDLDVQLKDLGVQVRPHGNEVDETDYTRRCEEALAVEIRERGSGRGPAQISRDANSMAMVWRTRRKRGINAHFWPGAWIVSWDRRIGPAYSAVNPVDRCPLVLNPPQFVGILTALSPPMSTERLAAAGVEFLSQETILSIATRFPTPVAIGLADVIGRSDDTRLDVKTAQLSFGDLISKDPDLFADTDVAVAKLAGELMHLKNERLRAGYVEQRRFSEAAIQQTSEVAAADAERARLAQVGWDHAEHTVGDQGSIIADLQRANQAWQSRARRQKVVYPVLGVVAAVSMLTAILGLWAWFIGTVLTGVIFWRNGEEWIEGHHESVARLVASFLPELIGIISVLRS